jgi:predicted transcriptional regulator
LRSGNSLIGARIEQDLMRLVEFDPWSPLATCGRMEMLDSNQRSIVVVSIQLDPQQMKTLDDLAKRRGANASELARRIVVDFLEFQELEKDTQDDWAEASVALTPEVMDQERWESQNDGS